jgi:hypothetical protein
MITKTPRGLEAVHFRGNAGVFFARDPISARVVLAGLLAGATLPVFAQSSAQNPLRPRPSGHTCQGGSSIARWPPGRR